jgi:hypothetical protein
MGVPAALIVILLGAATSIARADFKIKMPDAEPGEFELETIGNYGRSGRSDTDNEQNFVHEIECGQVVPATI